jgi:uncharacterized BrkB/YihY/UPF0761 family membrane protein
MTVDESGTPPTGDSPGNRSRRSRRWSISTMMANSGDRVVAARGRWRSVDAAFLAVKHDAEVGGGVLAGAMAFRLFLFVVPLVFFLVALFGFGAEVVGQSPVELARHAGAGGLIAAEAAKEASQSRTDRIATIVVAGVTTALGALTALKVLRIVHGLVWAVPVPKMAHPWRATLVFTLVAAAALLVSALIGDMGSGSPGLGIPSEVLYVVLAFGVWLIISRHMPRPGDASWAALLPGAVLLALGTEIVHVVTVYWIAGLLSHKTATYGAIGIALTLLLWAYLVGRLIIASVVLNAGVRLRRHEGGDPEAPSS